MFGLISRVKSDRLNILKDSIRLDKQERQDRQTDINSDTVRLDRQS